MRRKLYGYAASFDNEHDLLNAARAIRANGYRRIHAYTPFSVEGLSEAVGMGPNWLPYIVLAGGMGGAGGGFLMQWYSCVISYPLNIGGRPLFSWPSFIPITFELGVLGASFAAFFGILLLCGLPKPYHPMFNARGFDEMPRGRFFLCIRASDPHFDAHDTWRFLGRLNPDDVTEVWE